MGGARLCFAHGQAPISAERGGLPCSVSPCQSRTCERLENVSRPNPGPPFAQCNFLAILWGSKGDTTKANRTRVRDAKPRAPRGQPSFRMSTARPFGIVVRGAPRNPQRFRLGLRTAGRMGTTVPHLPCRTGVGYGRPRDGFPPRRGRDRQGAARSTSSHASSQRLSVSAAPLPGAGTRCVVGRAPWGPRRIKRPLVARRLRPGATWAGGRTCGDTDALCEEERIPGRRGDGELGCRVEGIVRRREVGDPSVASAPRSGGFRRSGRKGVGRDLIAPDCVPGEPSWLEAGSPGRARIREGPGPLSFDQAPRGVRRACRPRALESGPGDAR